MGTLTNTNVNTFGPVYLQITLPTLVTDGTVQRMVHQQELHHTLPVISIKIGGSSARTLSHPPCHQYKNGWFIKQELHHTLPVISINVGGS